MRLTLEVLHYTFSISVDHDEPEVPDSERHDTTLVERAGTDRDPAAELDQRTRLGFR